MAHNSWQVRQCARSRQFSHTHTKRHLEFWRPQPRESFNVILNLSFYPTECKTEISIPHWIMEITVSQARFRGTLGFLKISLGVPQEIVQ